MRGGTMRGFFSVVVVGMAVILLIAIFYAQQSQLVSEQETTRSLVVQQTLSKEWFLARQAYSQFAADAIAEALDTQLNGPFSAGSCPNGSVGGDFTTAVNARWADVNVFLQNNADVNCWAIIAPALESSACGIACLPYGEIRSQQEVFVQLTCAKDIQGVLHQLSYPFTLNKRIELNWNSVGSTCSVIVSDNIPSPHITEINQALT